MTKQGYTGPLEEIDECCWRIPRDYKPGMQVEGRIYADGRLMDQIRADQAPEQVANVAFLPGIQEASLAMPDIHWGYGFCIGGVCATDPEERAEFMAAWEAAGVTCILQNAGEEGNAIDRLLKRLARFTYVTDMIRDFLPKAVTPDDIVAAKRQNRHCPGGGTQARGQALRGGTGRAP